MNPWRFSFFFYSAVTVLAANCVSIEGGAIEAIWDLRNAEGDRPPLDTFCQEAQIASIYFELTPVNNSNANDPCLEDSRCRFDCQAGGGITPFFIPEDDYAISLKVVSTSGASLSVSDGITSPPPIVRHVKNGEITDLNINVIKVERTIETR